jgi:hypothetical protein
MQLECSNERNFGPHIETDSIRARLYAAIDGKPNILSWKDINRVRFTLPLPTH